VNVPASRPHLASPSPTTTNRFYQPCSTTNACR
jgi:hypothetical protein